MVICGKQTRRALGWRDRLQYQAFLAFFRSSEGGNDERFVRAVLESSDRRYEQQRRRDRRGFAGRLRSFRAQHRRGAASFSN
jgi:hypothetical protein